MSFCGGGEVDFECEVEGEFAVEVEFQVEVERYTRSNA